ncbi:tripartite tricarboxylate transporter substrate binding protein [Hydrogenophaga sp.]|uniref:tripartite tricarboxylate transporter substrate binding protein n=1 Tax=Hydrogenophaga sp. TaxID=1904254 RepID=UPI0019C15B29|nr:tripartite tricarboxylate transporter substrate binding protein [Hydrogenophaga sp.]MBD3893025.1 tripartite tricarboxylate transporter substrate binding protein [Hydrogenophaga sp.]
MTPNGIQRRHLLCATAGLTAATLLPTVSSARDRFPSRPITLIAPWPAGGSSDTVLRAFAQSAGRSLGVPMLVENRPGAGGTLGAAAMLNARPDGYTLTQLPLSVFRLPHMQATRFDPVRDISHIIGLVGYTFGIVATPTAAFSSLQELVRYARARPGTLEYGHSGHGTTPHLAVEEFSRLAAIELNPIPFGGTADALQAILGGHIRVMSGTTEFAPHVRSGRLRLLATLGQQRSPAFADVPTVKESGWNTISESPFGIGGPRGLDPLVQQGLHDAFKQALHDPQVQSVLERFFMPTIYMNSADYAAYAERTFRAERATIERLGLARRG